MIGPLAFRMPLPARPADYAAFAGFAIGVLGMVSHFWMDLPAGMAWAAGLVACTMSYVAIRVLSCLVGAPVPLEARLPVALAFVNVIAAAGLGVVVAVNKVSPILTVSHLHAVFAHAHLAALGWGTMMVVGAGYRILPMILPAAMPRGPWAYAGPVLLEGGVAGLLWAFFNGGRGLALFAMLAVAGIAAFLSRVLWMLRHRRPAPTELRRPDWSVAHAIQALFCLAAACGLGLYLAFSERSETTLALALAYGVLGLVGFLSQIVVGVLGTRPSALCVALGLLRSRLCGVAAVAPSGAGPLPSGPRLRTLGGRSPSVGPRPRFQPDHGRLVGGRGPARGGLRQPRQRGRRAGSPLALLSLHPVVA